MRLGITAAGGTVADFNAIIQRVIDAEADGFDTIWFNSGALGEPLTAIAIAGRETQRIELMTAITVTYTRHPFLMAQQALSTSEACGGRFTLGIGPSHRVSMERLGIDYNRAAAHTREYVTVLQALLSNQTVEFHGEFFNVETQLGMPWAQHRPPVVVAALAPLMLRMAGELADGTVTWMVGLETMKQHIIPRITAAAQAANRPAPRICIGLPVTVTDDVPAARAKAAQSFGFYGALPVYKRVLDIEGGGPADVLVCGNEDEVAAQLRAFAAAGATEFNANPYPVGDNPAASVQRTRELLKSLAGTL